MAYDIVPTEQINCDRQILLGRRIISIMMDYPMCKTVGEGGKEASVMNDRRNSLVNPAAELVAVAEAASVSVVTAAMGNIRKLCLQNIDPLP